MAKILCYDKYLDENDENHENEDDDENEDDEDDEDEDVGRHQPLYLVPVEGEGVHIIETDWSIILSHHNLHHDRFNSNHHHP